ncbi:hypothetical protein BH09PAT3_BH09PAT3_2060 [soil metagenome]
MGLINAAFDATDRIMRVKEQQKKQAKAKALAKQRINEKTSKKDNFELF